VCRRAPRHRKSLRKFRSRVKPHDGGSFGARRALMRDCHKTLHFSREGAERIIFSIDFLTTQLNSRHRNLSIRQCVGRVPLLTRCGDVGAVPRKSEV